MVTILVCDRDERESAAIAKDCCRQVAQNGEEDLHLECLADDGSLARTMDQEKLMDLLYYDFQKGQGLEELQAFRRQYASAMLMLITGPAVSPLEYLRPGVAPDSLLIRPISEDRLRQTNAEFMGSFFERYHSRQAESSFVVDTREERVFIPFSHIYYFEARDKKLFVRLRDEEYAFYDTMDALEKRLPKVFRRSHRSYIVNTTKIVRIFSAENYIELKNKIGVPISRSYKPAFQEKRL